MEKPLSVNMQIQYYRTFIGIPVRVNDEFLRAREELINTFKGERISWVAPHNYHVTLRFIGETEPSVVRALGKALREKIEVPRKSHVKLGHPGLFGPRKNPRVIWIGFDDTRIFDSLKTEVDSLTQDCGITPAEQPFRAHLTLGRIRNLKDNSHLSRYIESVKEAFSYQVLLERLVFYRSELGDGGPVYTPLVNLDFRA